jgi:predicted Zn-dependent protease
MHRDFNDRPVEPPSARPIRSQRPATHGVWRSPVVAALVMSILPALILAPERLDAATPDALPTIGDASTAVVSLEQEKAIGNAWLRMLRAQAPTIEDPLLLSYLENVTGHLASNSELQDPSLLLVIMDSPDINAFAAPGGVMGINAGLFLHARNESELSAVIAHELAHMSQRHFARGVENQQRTSYSGMAALLASVVLAATGGAQAGMAALATTQASLIQQQLRFSRHNEREADNIGIQTLERAGLSPHAMADFFEQMNRANRFSGGRPPDFLLTHPITEARISEAKSRAQRYPNRVRSDSLEFQLMRHRVAARYAKEPSLLREQWEQQRSAADDNESIIYGIGMAALRQFKFADAREEFNTLLAKRPDRLTYRLAIAEVAMAEQKYADAALILEKIHRTAPDFMPASAMLAEAYLRSGKAEQSVKLLRTLLRSEKNAPHLWARLAEAQGKRGDRLGVYMAQAEYFYEHGLLDRAEEQLRFAIPLADRQFETTARLHARLKDIQQERLNRRF